MSDDYELLPRNEIEHLRKEIEKIKGKPLGADSDTVIGAIKQLQTSIDALVRVFGDANELLKVAPPDHPMNIHNDQLSRLEMQNEKIARSMINLATLVKKQQSVMPRPMPAQPRPPAKPVQVKPIQPKPEVAIPPKMETHSTDFSFSGGQPQHAPAKSSLDDLPPPPRPKSINRLI